MSVPSKGNSSKTNRLRKAEVASSRTTGSSCSPGPEEYAKALLRKRPGFTSKPSSKQSSCNPESEEYAKVLPSRERPGFTRKLPAEQESSCSPDSEKYAKALPLIERSGFTRKLPAKQESSCSPESEEYAKALLPRERPGPSRKLPTWPSRKLPAKQESSCSPESEENAKALLPRERLGLSRKLPTKQSSGDEISSSEDGGVKKADTFVDRTRISNRRKVLASEYNAKTSSSRASTSDSSDESSSRQASSSKFKIDKSSDSTDSEELANRKLSSLTIGSTQNQDSSQAKNEDGTPTHTSRVAGDALNFPTISESSKSMKNRTNYFNLTKQVKRSPRFIKMGNKDVTSHQMKPKKKGGSPYRRVKDENVRVDRRLKQSSLAAKQAIPSLAAAQGKLFRHEKNKKKRSCQFGKIDLAVKSIPFDD